MMLPAAKQRQLIVERYSDVATHLARTYPIKTSSGFLVPVHVYRKIALECDGDEDQCIQRLYAWADNAGAAEQSDLSTDAEEGEDAEEETKEMLDVNALD